MSAAAERVQQYVEQRTGRRGLDPDVIHGLDTGAASEADLTISDLRELLAELKRTKERCWALCTGNEFHGRVFEYRAECSECGMTRAEYERVLNPPEVKR